MQTKNLINGKWVTGPGSATFDVTNPATDEVIAEVPDGDEAHARAAIDAASEAQQKWRTRPATERADRLRTFATIMQRERERLAAIMTAEQGKPIREARGEIDYAGSFIAWAAGEAERIYGDIIPATAPDKRILVLRQPVGVTAAITPWNFPSAMITRKLGPALAAGCTQVVRPASATPLSAIALGEVADEAGIPPGVVNIITGSAKAIGKAIFDDSRVRKVSFTGSTEVGKTLIRQSADQVMRLSLELGGHAPFIIFDDADVDLAIEQVMAAKFRNTGQSCVALNMCLVHESLYERVRDGLAAKIAKLIVGPGNDEKTDIGPLIDDDAVAKAREHVEDARDRGATVVHGGETLDMGAGYTDRFFMPTLLDQVDDAMQISTEETFGPVLPLRTFHDEAEAVAIANNSRFGLAAYFCTQNAARLLRVAEALEYGIIGINDGVPSTAQAPFGGVKESGYGREGGQYVMHEYLDIKYISIGGV
ncbi:MAG: NAD-dependent succinate-semialdehyde dehydrogenase [Phycisphaerales bacterium]